MSNLKKTGAEVREADSGFAALDVCKDFEPDLVLSDWMMPGMDGLEFCRAFRQLSRESYGYFILLTSKTKRTKLPKGWKAARMIF